MTDAELIDAFEIAVLAGNRNGVAHKRLLDTITELRAEVERLTAARAIGQAAGYFKQLMTPEGVSGAAIHAWLAEWGAP